MQLYAILRRDGFMDGPDLEEAAARSTQGRQTKRCRTRSAGSAATCSTSRAASSARSVSTRRRARRRSASTRARRPAGRRDHGDRGHGGRAARPRGRSGRLRSGPRSLVRSAGWSGRPAAGAAHNVVKRAGTWRRMTDRAHASARVAACAMLGSVAHASISSIARRSPRSPAGNTSGRPDRAQKEHLRRPWADAAQAHQSRLGLFVIQAREFVEAEPTGRQLNRQLSDRPRLRVGQADAAECRLLGPGQSRGVDLLRRAAPATGRTRPGQPSR